MTSILQGLGELQRKKNQVSHFKRLPALFTVSGAHVYRPTDLQTQRSVSGHFAWCFMKLAMPAS